MKSKHFLALLTAAALCTAIPATNSTMISHADAAEEPVKIMAVGDSITDGYWEQGAYRKYLYRDLNANGITNIDMVGPKGSNEEQYDSFSYDGNYAGYSGYAIQYITGTETRQGIYETLKDGNLLETYQPDLVLLQIGTNDILSAYNDGIADRLEHLVDYIASYLPEDGRLFIASIPDIDVATVYSWFWAYGSEYYGVDPAVFAEKIQAYIDTYNASIQQLVAAKQSAGMSIQFCDINAVVDLTTDLYDGVHPNEAGYENMGKCWAETLTAYFNGSDVPPVSTTTTAATTTTTTTTSATATDLTSTEPTTTETTTTTKTTTESTSTLPTTTPAASTTSTTSTTAEQPPFFGDINLDGSISLVDAVQLQRFLLGDFSIPDEAWERADLNQDQSINGLDLAALKRILLQF